jgi:hypothetical protein
MFTYATNTLYLQAADWKKKGQSITSIISFFVPVLFWEGREAKHNGENVRNMPEQIWIGHVTAFSPWAQADDTPYTGRRFGSSFLPL